MRVIIGRKGIEPLIAMTIEFTAQPVIPTNGTFLFSLQKYQERNLNSHY